MQFCIMRTTFDKKSDARRAVMRILEQRLAACGQMRKIESGYWWRGAIRREKEWLVEFKTRKELCEPLASAIKEMHPYEVPEIVALDVAEGSPEYLAWIEDSTTKPCE